MVRFPGSVYYQQYLFVCLFSGEFFLRTVTVGTVEQRLALVRSSQYYRLIPISLEILENEKPKMVAHFQRARRGAYGQRRIA